MKLSKNQKQTITILVIGLICLFFSFPIDNFIKNFIENIQHPIMNYLFSWISYVLSLIFILLVMTSLFMWEENKRDWIIPLWASCGLAFVLTYIIKIIVARDRPDQIEYLFGFVDYSFPSAHAATSFAAVPILDKEYPMLKWFWILFASLIAISRLYLGVHFLSDVIAGSLVGFIIGKTIIYIKKKYSIFG
jgi:undecaprenyl-diphosphatase